ncbi:hypothetical protein AJ87_33920 [Rhizobium yanglingense]|nr:hypothetical protein AJ87_33920 [Rhizobium yanglingense]
MRSRKSRSWLTRITVPGKPTTISCSRSSVSRSRSLVGSSRIRRLVGRARMRASISRARSPPDRFLIGVRACSGWKRNSFM